MRFVLRQGSREVIFFSENRFMRFDGPEVAADFLLDYLIEVDNLARLREALRGHQTWSWLADRDDGTVLDYTAKLLTDGMMHMLADPEAVLPWTWQFRSPTFPVEVVQGDFEANPLVGLEDVIEELEAELEDIIPDPVLPPTFIQVADFEAKGIEFLEKMYEMAMDLLRFVGLEGELPSELAPNFTEVAATNGVAINAITESFVAEIDPLAMGTLAAVGTTQAGEQMLKLAESQGFGVKAITETLGDAIGDLVEGKGDLPSPTVVGPALLNEATKQGANIGGITADIAQTLEIFDDPIDPELPDTELGPLLAEAALAHVSAMTDAQGIVANNLAFMASMAALELPPPTVPAEMVNLANSQMVGVMSSTLATLETFQALLSYLPPGDPQISVICQEFQAATEAQVLTLTQGTDFVGGEIRGLVMVALPEHHDPSPVGDAFEASARDQTAGMMRAASAFGESLATLALPPE